MQNRRMTILTFLDSRGRRMTILTLIQGVTGKVKMNQELVQKEDSFSDVQM